MPSKKNRDRKRQTKINFSPAPKSSPATKASPGASMGNDVSKHAQATPTKAKRPSRRSKQTKLAIVGPSRPTKRDRCSSTSEDELAERTEMDTRMVMPVQPRVDDISDDLDTDDTSSEDPEEAEELATKPKSRKRRRVLSDHDSDEDEDSVTVVQRKRQRRSQTKTKSLGNEDMLQENAEGGRRKRRKTKPHDDDDDDDDNLRAPPRSTHRKLTKKPLPTPVEEDEEEEDIASLRRKLTSRKSMSEEDEELHAPVRSARRRLRRRTPSPDIGETSDQGGVGDDGENEERDDLKEDLAFLRSSPLPDRGRLRSTHEKPKSKRQEALEALKKRRAGTNEPSSSATPARKRHIVLESDTESELEIIKEELDSDAEIVEDDDIEDDEDEEDEEEESRDANALDMFQEDQDDEGFIDDDAEGNIGEPVADLDELRVTLNLSKAKSKDLFRHAVEWMVMKKIHPGFESKKNIYTITFRKLNDEVKALAGSKFTSAAWTKDFTQALKARPDYAASEVPKSMRDVMAPHCAACNRSGHPASWEAMLTGTPYNSETLEPIEQDTDSSSEDSDDSELSADSSEIPLNGEKPTYNEAGDRIPPESHRFFLGSTCQANAQVSHTLYHWRYHLYSWVKDHLKAQGLLTAEKLVWRENRSDRKREKEAHKIVDAMESSGEVKKLYRQYKEQVRFAIEVSNDYKNGWGRRG